MLDNKFHYRSTAEIAAMLSVTTCQYKSREGEHKKDRDGENAAKKLKPAVLKEVEYIIPICLYEIASDGMIKNAK